MSTIHTLNNLNEDPTHVAPFINAAEALDFWVGQHQVMVNDENHRLSINGMQPMPLLIDMRLYQNSRSRQFSADICALEATREVLGYTVKDLADLVPGQRGRYLADLMTARCSDGEVDPFRFRVAHLLATYVSMMPTVTASGLVSTQTDETLFGWVSVHGNFVDLLALGLPENENWLDLDIEAALEVGQTWSDTFEGVRYLPLEDLTNARYYRPDGSWQPLAERDRLTSM